MLQNVQSNRLLSLVIPQLNLNCTMVRGTRMAAVAFNECLVIFGGSSKPSCWCHIISRKTKHYALCSRTKISCSMLTPPNALASQHLRTLDAQAMHIGRRSIHAVVMASRIFACSASARVCAAVMSHSDSVSGTGELNATTKGWNSGV